MLEQIHELLYAILRLHVNSDTGGELSPSMLKNVKNFTDILYKIHTFVEAQEEKSRIKQFFRQGEITTLLKGCKMGLDQAIIDFQIQRSNILTDIAAMERCAQKTHQEMLDLIALSDGNSSDGASSVWNFISLETPQTNMASSNSLSLLPSEPPIFYGRESEILTILQSFTDQVPRIAILGAGGIGKTSLARAVLHHPAIAARYETHRLFIRCDTVSTCVQLVALIGAHIGLTPVKDLTRPVIHHFSTGPPTLLILDNLETVWESTEGRGNVEQFLSSLTNVDHLALIVGPHHNARCRKARQRVLDTAFSEALKTVTLEAARQTFIEITDDVYDTEVVDQILLVTDKMPLAIDLIAHLVDSEGPTSVLARWDTERTFILSEGYDRKSNLELSISLSLSSTRITSSPHALDLLSLLSILPDGLSDLELLQSKLPIENILSGKSTLLRTALAYTDDKKRLKSLVPIREYLQKKQKPTNDLIRPLYKHFQELLEFYTTDLGTLSSSNFVNIENVLLAGLDHHNPDLLDTLHSICDFDDYSYITGFGLSPLLEQIRPLLPHPSDHKLELHLITRLLGGRNQVGNSTQLIDQGLEHVEYIDATHMKYLFYIMVADHYRRQEEYPRAMQFSQTALALAISTGNTEDHSHALGEVAIIESTIGNYSAGQVHAKESQRLAKLTGNLLREASALDIECICWGSLGHTTHLLPLLNRAAHLLELCGMAAGGIHSNIMCSKAEVHRCKTEYIEARKIHTQRLQNAPILREPYLHAMALLSLAQIDIDLGADANDMHKNIDTAESIFASMGYSCGLTYCDLTRASVLAKERKLSEAQQLFRKCLIFGWGKDAQIISVCLERLADTADWNVDDNLSTAATVFLVHSLKLRQSLEILRALQFLGDMYLMEGEQETAISLFTVALEGFTHMDVHRNRAECMLRLGDISEIQGDTTNARELWDAAKPLFERSSQKKEITDIDARLTRIAHEVSTRNDTSLSGIESGKNVRIHPPDPPDGIVKDIPSTFTALYLTFT
ncbi:hypothetical protein DFH09DRAFT_1292368 [Mycena vulgaris]|nr:hypothetical protein DFH09DRAFT_1292368 [Mycena vulgaris]